jgi:prepilin-type N-terminal cleavage/methylation domain-containing protein
MSRGFTLLELLVGVALMALLSGLLFAALRLGADGLDRVDATAQAAEDRRIVAAFLRQRLANAIPVIERDATGAHVAFDGSADRLRLVTDMPPAVGGGAHRLELDNTARGLRLTWTPLLGPDAEAAPTSRHLATVAARFAYYGQRAGEAAPVWHAQWRDELALPRLVRLQLAGEPPLIVALAKDQASR